MAVVTHMVKTKPKPICHHQTLGMTKTKNILVVINARESVVNKLCFKPVALSVSIFLAMTYILCVAYGLIFHEYAMYKAWETLLPGFSWLTWTTFLIGLVETILYGIYVALVFVPLYNFFQRRYGHDCLGSS